MNVKESDIVKDIIKLVTLLGGIAIRVNAGLVVINEDQKDTRFRGHPQEELLQKAYGKKKSRAFRGGEPGVPDIIACIDGLFMGIEVKTPTGKVSKDQEKYLKRIKEAGGISMVARSVDDVNNMIEKTREERDFYK